MAASIELSIPERFDHILRIVSSERFLKMQGLGNEVPFFICPYMPSEALPMEQMQTQLVSKLSLRGISVLEVNLYDLCIQILKDRGIWERIITSEATAAKDQFKELLQGVLDPAAHVIPAIGARLAEAKPDILFLSGVGEVYPYLRSHTILNNLQSTAKTCPTLMFFPGSYTHSLESGASLDLFGRCHDDKYYRAFNIYDCRA